MTLILVGNKWYSENALNEAIEDTYIRLSTINKHNPLAAPEYNAVRDQYAELLRAARDNNLIVSSKTTAH